MERSHGGRVVRMRFSMSTCVYIHGSLVKSTYATVARATYNQELSSGESDPRNRHLRRSYARDKCSYHSPSESLLPCLQISALEERGRIRNHRVRGIVDIHDYEEWERGRERERGSAEDAGQERGDPRESKVSGLEWVRSGEKENVKNCRGDKNFGGNEEEGKEDFWDL